jgi:hypothetical protein
MEVAMSKSLTTEVAKDGEVLLPKRDIAIKPIAKKMECNVCGAEADAVFHPTCNCNAGFRSKRQVAAEAIAQHPDKSDRAIAGEIGVDHKTVGRARADLEDVGTIPHADTRIDTKGRQRPATKPDRPLTEHERHRRDVEAVIKQIIKWFLVLGAEDRGPSDGSDRPFSH